MNIQRSLSASEAQGEATFGTADLRTENAGPPVIDCISRQDDPRRDVRIETSRAKRIRRDARGADVLRPFRLTEGPGLDTAEETLLRRRGELDPAVLVAHGDRRIGYTEDAIERLAAI